MIQVLKLLPKGVVPMAALRTAISALGNFDPQAEAMSPEANYKKAVALLAKTGPIIGAFQSLLDEGAQHDLEAHGEPELRRRPTGQDSGPLEDVRRENEQDPRLVREHRRLRCWPCAHAGGRTGL